MAPDVMSWMLIVKKIAKILASSIPAPKPIRAPNAFSLISVSFQLGGCEGKFKLPPKGPKVFVNVVSFTKLNARVSVLFKKDEFGQCLQPRDLGLQRLNAVGTD